ncbi:MAG: hypothetical protein ISR76_07200 [Planctomycetes bacterium]|nr:hypothetical protein [Planctomycetota bacterium]
MNRTDAASLAFRLLGIWFLLQTAQYALQALVYALETDDRFPTPWRWTVLAAFVVYFFATWFLLTKAQDLANRFYPPPADADAEKPPSAGPADWQAAALAVLGIWMIAGTLPDLVTVVLGTQSEEFPASFWIQQPVFQPVLRLVLGLVLTLGCHRIAAWWTRSRAEAPLA